ncbi:sh3 domain-binding glutamic acid-rich protein [Anaeramoeba ignava]|uniref:Sh3 domain-binding glutamic acid-rich protein n=1 Tax=Anaeramoeba ignava TaxID=1746090 RepID=A0A9Q0LVF2_ANAIG|nr:sh3 domain-binding glutamic acid-rich protein [Anaeramoeba ignava]
MSVEIFTSIANSSLFAKKYTQYIKLMLDIKKINYVVYDIGKDENKREEMISRSQRSSFPQLHVNGQFIGEWKEIEDLNELEDLDPILGIEDN